MFPVNYACSQVAEWQARNIKITDRFDTIGRDRRDLKSIGMQQVTDFRIGNHADMMQRIGMAFVQGGAALVMVSG